MVCHQGLPSSSGSDDVYATVNAGLMAKIEMLESENVPLKHKKLTQEPHFKLKDIMHDDHLVKAYTGFWLYELLIAFLLTISTDTKSKRYH